MRKLAVLFFLTSTLWADTIVSGSSSYQGFFYPKSDNTLSEDSSESSFNLLLSGGQFTDISIGHVFERGAKGGGDQNLTTGFTVQPEDPTAIGVIGLPTQFSVTLNGVTYVQTFSSSNLPPAGSNFSASIMLTPISGTNVVDTTQPSTASGLFQLSGDVSADIGGTTYTDSFSGYAAFTGSYTFVGIGGYYELDESYTFSPVLTPEPASVLQIAGGLGALLAFVRVRRYFNAVNDTAER